MIVDEFSQICDDNVTKWCILGEWYGQIKDPFGHIWEIATHKKDMTKDEIDKAAEEFFE